MINTLADKHILLGVTGGIAAYKTAELVRRLREYRAIVRVVMTRAATEFITPLTLQTLSGHAVHTELFDLQSEAQIGHIELARWADVVLIAPATANFLAKLTHGFADDLLTTLCLATTAPLRIAPAMNQQMWQAIATQENCLKLQQRGVILWGPAVGEQACGEVGAGRMLEPIELVELLQDSLTDKQLAGVKITVTAGATREAIDPVRFISNRSSGKMGYAVARAAQQAGAIVTLISGANLPSPQGVKTVRVETAQQMFDAVQQMMTSCDIFIGAAAVADYRPVQPADNKIKKHSETLEIRLERTLDILAHVATLPQPPFTVGFAAETDHLIEYAKDKLQRKKLNLIAANQVGQALGFEQDDNALTVLWADGMQELPRCSKTELAQQLISLIVQHYQQWSKP
ncbi:MAG: bifunctional phosphopantothenoylcysteine decarboxylase/phosphopantothenate--cysteine ligase CoaBC [Thiotrichaceae bacterium]